MKKFLALYRLMSAIISEKYFLYLFYRLILSYYKYQMAIFMSLLPVIIFLILALAYGVIKPIKGPKRKVIQILGLTMFSITVAFFL